MGIKNDGESYDRIAYSVWNPVFNSVTHNLCSDWRSIHQPVIINIKNPLIRRYNHIMDFIGRELENKLK